MVYVLRPNMKHFCIRRLVALFAGRVRPEIPGPIQTLAQMTKAVFFQIGLRT
uniref:Uncharacterized protein n=1 Tax=Romanomermis culicivorax TaxID=13658 RepID=A0A915JB98_ROMCU